MEKKNKLGEYRRPNGGVKGGGIHRQSHSHGNFQRLQSFSGRFSQLHGQPVGENSDPKSKKATLMRRAKTQPELMNRDKPVGERTLWLNLETPFPLFSGKVSSSEPVNNVHRSAKLLVKVSVMQSTGPLRVLLSDDATVVEVITAALAMYAKERRRPILNNDPHTFGLHYSQFTIDCLNMEEKIKDLNSRNFFLYPKMTSAKGSGGCVVSCRREMNKMWKIKEPWYKGFLLL